MACKSYRRFGYFRNHINLLDNKLKNRIDISPASNFGNIEYSFCEPEIDRV
jgi:hypothetical protein